MEEALGRVVPVGKRRRWLPAVGPVTVTLRTTALTPVAGTPCWPVIWTLRVWAACHLVAVVPVPSRESSSRPGLSGVNTSPSAL